MQPMEDFISANTSISVGAVHAVLFPTLVKRWILALNFRRLTQSAMTHSAS